MKRLRDFFRNNKEGVLKSIYALPIGFAIVISVFHCITWFEISNPSIFAITMSIAIEVAAATTLVALMFGKLNTAIIVTFILVTIYQLLGNVFFSFHHIDEDGNLFTSWVYFVNILLGEGNEWSSSIHKFWLAVMAGSVVPALSITSLWLIGSFKFRDDKSTTEDNKEEIKETPVEIEIIKEEKPIEPIEEVKEPEVIEVEIKKEIPVVEFPIVEEEVVKPVEKKKKPAEKKKKTTGKKKETSVVEFPIVEEEVVKPVEKKKETPKTVKSKIVLGNPNIKIDDTSFVRSTKPAVVEKTTQPVEEKNIKKINLPGFKK